MAEKAKGLPIFVRVQNAIKDASIEDTFMAFVLGLILGAFVVGMVAILAAHVPSRSQQQIDAIENCQARGYTRDECFAIVVGNE